MGIFTYDENMAELERMERRRDELARQSLLTTAEARELVTLDVEIAKMRTWLKATSRIEGHELRS